MGALRGPSRLVALASLAVLPVWSLPSTPLTISRAVDRSSGAAVAPSAASASVAASSSPDPANIEYDPGGYGWYNQAALTNPNIDAVDINLNWYQVEPQPGVFDFAPADQEVAAWVAQGKKVTLELRFQHETNASTASCSDDGWLPTWVASSVPVLCETKNSITGLVIPDYFNPTFLKDWRTYVGTVAGHFADGPYKDDVTYTRTAIGLGAESFPLEPCYMPAVQGCDASAYRAATHQLQRWGYTGAKWLRWQESLLSYYKREFAFTTVIYPINQMLYPASNPLNLNAATGDPIDMDVAYWAAAHGIGIGQEGLDGRYVKDYAKFNEIDAHVHRRFPKAYIEFQTVNEVSNKGTSSCSAACLFQKDVQAAEHYHARSIEWYSVDDLEPTFQPFLAQWQQWVDK